MEKYPKTLIFTIVLALTGCSGKQASAFSSTLVCRDTSGNETYRVTGEGRWIPHETGSLYNTYTMDTYQKRRDESCSVNVTIK